MAHTPYIPRADGAFDSWQANYVAYVRDHAHPLGLSAADLLALETLQAGWRKNYAETTDARAYLASAAAAKVDARAAYEAELRRLSGRIRTEPAVTDADRLALGLAAPDGRLTPVPAPATWPLLSIDAGARLQHTLHFVDSDSPTRKARPRGVSAIQIFLAMRRPGEKAPIGPGDFSFSQLATRTPTVVAFEGSAAGLTAYYAARWTSTRAAAGPWGPISSATIGG